MMGWAQKERVSLQQYADDTQLYITARKRKTESEKMTKYTNHLYCCNNNNNAAKRFVVYSDGRF